MNLHAGSARTAHAHGRNRRDRSSPSLIDPATPLRYRRPPPRAHSTDRI